MSDTFNITATWDKATYVAGETITATISGTNTHTEDTVTETLAGPVNIPVVAASGAQSVVSIPQVTVTTTQIVTTTEDVLIDLTRPVVDSSATPRNWVVSPDRKSIAAVA